MLVSLLLITSVFSEFLTIFFTHKPRIDLGVDATLVLTFDQPVPGLYQEKFPVIWK